MRQVTFTLRKGEEGQPSQADRFRTLAGDSNKQGKIFRYYFAYNYQLPSDLTLVENDIEKNKTTTVAEKFVIDDLCDEKLKDLIEDVRTKGYKVNRSSIMRHVFDELNELLAKNPDYVAVEGEVSYTTSNFYFEDGTKEILQELISFRQRHAVIERFIMDEYEPPTTYKIQFDPPTQIEQINLKLNKAAIAKLDEYVDALEFKNVTRTALMRDVIYSLIKKLSNSDARTLILDRKLETLLKEYIQREGKKAVKLKIDSILRKI